MSTPSASSSRVGEILAEKYRITRLLGEGGMGTVYEAQHQVVGRRFAVKYLHAELAREPELLERFRREARAAGALESENIVSVVDFGVAGDGIPYLVMELLVGEDLASLLAREGPLPVVRAVNLIIQACRGLDAAHAAGIVHRDLKPENLFVGRRGDGTDLVKLLDFGIAKLADAGRLGPVASVTRSGATMGTPFYMPPEQARGAKDVDHRSDLYALGVILFEALSGRKPHPGTSYNEILYHILTQPPAALAELRPGLPADLVATVHRALAFEPDDRPRSAVELARALSRHAGREVTPIRSQFDLQVTRDAGPALPLVTGTPIAAAPSRMRGGRLVGIAAGLVVALVAAAAWWLVPAADVEPRRPKAPVPIPSRPAAPVAAVVPDGGGTPASPPPTAPATVETPAPPSPAPTASARSKGRKSSSRSQGDARRPPRAPVFDERNPYQ